MSMALLKHTAIISQRVQHRFVALIFTLAHGVYLDLAPLGHRGLAVNPAQRLVRRQRSLLLLHLDDGRLGLGRVRRRFHLAAQFRYLRIFRLHVAHQLRLAGLAGGMSRF